MMPSDSQETLGVWRDRDRVGTLWRDDQDRMGFVYDPNWIDTGFPIGNVLPLREEPFEPQDGQAHAWFSNLLPEADARNRIVRQLGISDDDYLLLKHIGADCAGALSVLPREELPDLTHGAEPITDDQLHQWLLQPGPYGFARMKSQAREQSRPRLSLAGAQAKSPVLIEDGRYFLPVGATPSSHILKFEIPDLRHVPLYEFYLNQLARLVGLPVPEITMNQLNGRRYRIVERYDRIRVDGKRHRKHQEDFCQVAGLRSTRKYQADQGPNLAYIAESIRRISARPAGDLLHLLRWQIFNWLAGNSDGHAKNLSLVHASHANPSWRLAPFYDLVCTRAWPNLDEGLAMTVGDESDPGRIGRREWEAEARSMSMRPGFVLAEVQAMASQIGQAVEPLRMTLEAQFGRLPMLQQPEAVVKKQLRIARSCLN